MKSLVMSPRTLLFRFGLMAKSRSEMGCCSSLGLSDGGDPVRQAQIRLKSHECSFERDDFRDKL